MIVITGSVTAREGAFERLRVEGVAHSTRLRAEEGCLSHRCYIDAEETNRLFFHEEWRDLAAVEAHFRHPDTALIMAVIRDHATASQGPVMLRAEPAQ